MTVSASPLGGRVILVLGGSRGIGAASALALARAGAAVVVGSRRAEACAAVAAAITAAGGQARAIGVDVTRFEQVEAAVAMARDRFGRLDGLFHNAGRILGTGALADVDPAVWHETFALNLAGPLHSIRAAAPVLGAQGGGSIVINTARSALRGLPTIGLYSAAKAAATMLAQVAAQELGPLGIRVNVLAPGYIGSDAWMDRLGDQAAQLARRVPLQRIGTPEDVARCLVWLMGDAARYISGVVLPVDGGMTAG